MTVAEQQLSEALREIELAYYAIKAEGGMTGRGLRRALEDLRRATERALENA